MPLLFMDTGYDPNSPGCCPSSEEGKTSSPGMEKEGEGQLVAPRGTKRREKNRDAARKSRRKQTERADELHEELQRLEQSNSALKKEIAALRKDLQQYESALERHQPFCRLKGCDSSTSVKPKGALQSFAHAERTPIPSSAPAQSTSAGAEEASPSAELCDRLTSSPFMTQPAPHSLFSEAPPLRPTSATLARLGLVSNAAQVHKASAAAESHAFCRSARRPDSLPVPSHLSRLMAAKPPNRPQLFPSLSRPQTSNAAGFASVQTFPATPEPLLSLLTTPSPVIAPPSGLEEFHTAAEPSDHSLSELLEINDWILSGPVEQHQHTFGPL